MVAYDCCFFHFLVFFFFCWILFGNTLFSRFHGTSILVLLFSYDSHSFSLLFDLQQIHALVMSLSYTGIEIKTAHSLESWNGGVLVMVSGSVQLKNLNRMRNFVQTFFLAPQEKGYFVLNDIFHFVDEDPVHHYPAVLLSQSNLDSTLNAPTAVPETGWIC